MSEPDPPPALGKPGGPAEWRRAIEGAAVAHHRRAWEDSRWSYLFKDDTDYATGERPSRSWLRRVNREGRRRRAAEVQGPVIKAPVWTWEVPAYFWFGGMAAGSSFVALACDLAGDERSARIARRVALAAMLPNPPLLIADLGRPERFYNMLRVFKPRSPMNLGAWSLAAFGGLMTAAVGADLLGRRRTARAINVGAAVVGGYVGSYTGVLLATTAVPVWARSRLFLGPIFVATATATGASTVRLTLALTGTLPPDHPTRQALGRIETGAIAVELLLSEINEHQLGPVAHALEEGRAGRAFNAGKWLVRTGLALRLGRDRLGAGADHVASACYMAGALCFRHAWVWAGPNSAADDETVAAVARERG